MSSTGIFYTRPIGKIADYILKVELEAQVGSIGNLGCAFRQSSSRLQLVALMPLAS
jgi:hypothetical protein